MRISSTVCALLSCALAGAFTSGCGAPPAAEPASDVPLVDLARDLPLARVEPTGRVRVHGDRLVLARGARAGYFAQLPPHSVVSWDGLRPRGSDPGVLVLTVTREGGPSREVLRTDTAQGVNRIALSETDEGGGLFRLTVAVESSSSRAAAKDGAGGYELRRPRVTVPRETVEPETAAANQASENGRGSTETAPVDPLRRRRPNVVIYLIDTLRADRLGCYGNQRGLTPHIDAFARQSVLFENTVSQASWTRPSVASLFTGLWPPSHRAYGRLIQLVPEVETLAEVLHRHGYRTAGLLANPFVSRAFGFHQGFDTYSTLGKVRVTRSWEVHEAAVRWFADRRRSGDTRPFFLYLHTVDPHTPYDPPPRFRERFAADVPRDGIGELWWLEELMAGDIPVTETLVRRVQDLYDAEVAENDESFGRLLELLEAAGVADDTLVILLSDHGEEFFEHGEWEHAKSLHTEQLDVPLIVRFPRTAPEGPRAPEGGTRIATPVQHIDLMPTLLAYLGLPIPEPVEGRDLTPLLENRPLPAPTRIYSHLDVDGFHSLAVTTPTWRLILGRTPERRRGTFLYHRLHDPRERRNLAGQRPVRSGYLESRIAARERATEAGPTPEEGELSEEMAQQLRALGYLR